MFVSSFNGVLAAELTEEKTRERFVIDSGVLNEKREILVHLPKEYNRSKSSFPVIYINDAEVHMDHTSSTAEFLFNQHRMPKAIVVGVVTPDRNRHLRPTPVKQQVADKTSGADLFLQFYEKELMREINKRYRTAPYNVVSGTSFGGLFAIHALLTKPHLFDAYVAVSPSLWWDNKVSLQRAESALISQMPLLETLSPRKLYLSLANEEKMMSGPYGAMITLLKDNPQKQLSWSDKIFENETHNSGVLLSQYQGFSEIFKVWGIPDRQQTLVDLLSRYAAMSAQIKSEIILPEDRANGYGKWLYYSGRLDEATEMFEWNVKTYPNSANAHDSLGLAYEKAGRLLQAKSTFEKAALLSQENDPDASKNYQASIVRVAEKMTKN